MRRRMFIAINRWVMRRLQRKMMREWADYRHRPEVSVGPFFRSRRLARNGTQVYRSLVQIHFHRR
jgi:hypothetical protein